MLNFSKYSLNTKVIISLFIFILFFIIIRFTLIIPKIQKDSFESEIKNITNSLQLIKYQIKLNSKFIDFQKDFEQNLIKEKLAHELTKIKLKSKEFSKKDLIEILKKTYSFKTCTIKVDDYISKKNSNDLFKYNNLRILDKWQKIDIDLIDNSNDFIFYYNTIIKPDLLLSLYCEELSINPGHEPLKDVLMNYKYNSFSLLSHNSNKKSHSLLIKKHILNEDSRPLYEENENLRKNRYWVATRGKLELGNLSAKQINDHADKKPIEHYIDNIKYFTWIIKTSSSKEYSFFLTYSIKKEDLLKINIINPFILLPETLISIFLSFIIILLVLKKLFKNINMITQTAIKINKGEKNIRSKVKGDDDIGILGVAFDSMLDKFEENIKTLDLKVKEKTKEISKSLEEKEVLLKEIHHRVKNNLAITITLIEMQEDEIKDEKAKKALVDIQERVFTMELLHRKLYESESLSEISFDEYIYDLTNSIAQSYDFENKVKMNIQVEKLNLNIETSMLYGLIVNELMTNAFKYAFKNKAKGKLKLKIFQEKEKLVLIFKDNGEGLKKDFSKLCNTTLGLKLIKTIVEFQLFGKINYIYEKGAKFIIEGDIKKITSLS